jgi:FMN phosphatase YigB (HAD superfamily)
MDFCIMKLNQFKDAIMITDLLFDFSRVILFPKDESYSGGLNSLYKEKVIKQEGRFLDYFRFNEELLDRLSELKGSYGLSLYTTDIVQNDPVAQKWLQPIFEQVFAANDLGISKKDSAGYGVIVEKLGREPQQVLFVDDVEENVQAARAAGLQSARFTSNEELFRLLDKDVKK